MKEGIALVLSVPFIIISTYFGVNAVDYHFDKAERQDVRQELTSENEDRAANLRQNCERTYKDFPDTLAKCLRVR